MPFDLIQFIKLRFGNVVWCYLSLKYLCGNSLSTCVIWDGRAPLCTAMQHQRHKLLMKVSSKTIFNTRLHTRLQMHSQSGRGSVHNSGCLASTTFTAMFEILQTPSLCKGVRCYQDSSADFHDHLTSFHPQQKSSSKENLFAVITDRERKCFALTLKG